MLVTRLPSRLTRYTCLQPSRSLVHRNSVPFASHSISSTTSTQAESRSVRTVRVAPVAASASITRSVFWSRLMRWRISSFGPAHSMRSEEHTSELQSQSNLVCRLLLEKKKKKTNKQQKTKNETSDTVH